MATPINPTDRMASHVRALSGYRLNYAKNFVSKCYQHAKYLSIGGAAGYFIQQAILPGRPHEMVKDKVLNTLIMVDGPLNTDEIITRGVTGLAVAIGVMLLVRLGRFLLCGRRIKGAAREFVELIDEMKREPNEANRFDLYCRINDLKNQIQGVEGPSKLLPGQETVSTYTRFLSAVEDIREGAMEEFNIMRGRLSKINASGTVSLPKAAVPAEKANISEGDVMPLLNHADPVMVERGLLTIGGARQVWHKEILEQTAAALERLAKKREVRPGAVLSSAFSDTEAVINALDALKTDPTLAPSVVEAETIVHAVRGEDYVWAEAQRSIERLQAEIERESRDDLQELKEKLDDIATELRQDGMCPRRSRQDFYSELFNQEAIDLFDLVFSTERAQGRERSSIYQELANLQSLFESAQSIGQNVDPASAAGLLTRLAEYLPEGKQLVYTNTGAFEGVIARVKVLSENGTPEQRTLAREMLPNLLKQLEQAVKGGGTGPIAAAATGGAAGGGAKRAGGK